MCPRLLRGSGGMVPRKFAKLRCSNWMKMNFTPQNSLTFSSYIEIRRHFQVFQVARWTPCVQMSKREEHPCDFVSSSQYLNLNEVRVISLRITLPSSSLNQKYLTVLALDQGRSESEYQRKNRLFLEAFSSSSVHYLDVFFFFVFF